MIFTALNIEKYKKKEFDIEKFFFKEVNEFLGMSGDATQSEIRELKETKDVINPTTGKLVVNKNSNDTNKTDGNTSGNNSNDTKSSDNNNSNTNSNNKIIKSMFSRSLYIYFFVFFLYKNKLNMNINCMFCLKT